MTTDEFKELLSAMPHDEKVEFLRKMTVGGFDDAAVVDQFNTLPAFERRVCRALKVDTEDERARAENLAVSYKALAVCRLTLYVSVVTLIVTVFSLGMMIAQRK